MSAAPAVCVCGRLVHKADFERVLAAPSRSRSAHFAVHHLNSGPSTPVWRPRQLGGQELSTASTPFSAIPVDNPPAGHWLGSVVPKRHARRSVTRSLLKRQIRAVMAQHLPRLAPGLWLVRLRAPFAPAKFPSAASPALREAARSELVQLLDRAGRC